jgi:hypothetical protein
MPSIIHTEIEKPKTELSKRILETIEPIMTLIKEHAFLYEYHSNEDKRKYYETLITWTVITWLKQDFDAPIEKLQIDVEYSPDGSHYGWHRIIKRKDEVTGYINIDPKTLDSVEYSILNDNKNELQLIKYLSYDFSERLCYYYATIIAYLVYSLAGMVLEDFIVTIVIDTEETYEVMLIQ